MRKYDSAKEKRIARSISPILQVQDQQTYNNVLELRTAGDPLSLAAEVRAAIAQVDDKLPVLNLTSLRTQTDDSLRQERLLAQLVSFFGLLGLVLSCVGLYGIMAHAVVRRTNEIGIRMALGAERRDIIWMVLKESLLLVAIGTGHRRAGCMGSGPPDLQSAVRAQSERPVDAADGCHIADFSCRVGRLSAGAKSVARRSAGGAAVRVRYRTGSGCDLVSISRKGLEITVEPASWRSRLCMGGRRPNDWSLT